MRRFMLEWLIGGWAAAGALACSAPGGEGPEAEDPNAPGNFEEAGAIDEDQDGVPDLTDNCPTLANAAQEDLDSDELGDACDPDKDGDGQVDLGDCSPLDPRAHDGALEVCDGVDNDCNDKVDEMCDDAVSCTVDSCDGLDGCAHTPDDAKCDDGNPCSYDTCDPTKGCKHAWGAGLPCEDGLFCTAGDVCDQKGACLAGKARDCGASDACQTTSCNEETDGCAAVHTADGAACNLDDDGCTEESCQAGQCLLQGEVSCLEGHADCASTTCTSLGAFEHTCQVAYFDGKTCDDGLPCTTGESCAAGQCKGASSCVEDDLPCTESACVAGGCAVVAKAGWCYLGGACLEDGDAAGGAPCQVCDATSGALTNLPDGQACDDGDPSTLGDACTAGLCSGAPCACKDEGNPCTAEACSPAGSCLHVPTAGGCDDGDPCTKDDTCADGACSGTVYACDDGLACTANGCVGDGSCAQTLVAGYCLIAGACIPDQGTDAGGCKRCDATSPYKWKQVANGEGCDDGDLCSSDDACSGGACQGAPMACGVGLSCTEGTCAPALGAELTFFDGGAEEDGLAPRVLSWSGGRSVVIFARQKAGTQKPAGLGYRVLGPTGAPLTEVLAPHNDIEGVAAWDRAAATLTEKRFVVAWTSTGTMFSSGSAIRARVVDHTTGPVGDTFTVSNDTNHAQQAAIASWATGSAVITYLFSGNCWERAIGRTSVGPVWVAKAEGFVGHFGSSNNAYFYGTGLKSHQIAAAGPNEVFVGAAYNVYNALAHGGLMLAQVEPPQGKFKEDFSESDPGALTVAVSAAGDAAVAWESWLGDGDGYGVSVRVRKADGQWPAATGLATQTAGDQRRPWLCPESSFVLAAVWDAAGADGSGSGVMARRFGSDLAPAGEEVLVNLSTAGNQSHATAVATDGGLLLVTWQQEDVQTGRVSVRGRYVELD